MAEKLPAHSPLGASGAYRWMVCPGSVGLSKGVDDPESEFAALGTAAHALFEYCLSGGSDAWEHIGTEIDPGDGMFYPDPWGGERPPRLLIEVDKDMADAVQVALNAIRSQHPDRNQGNSFIEKPFHCPDLHPLFFGRSDFTFWDQKNRTLHVWDYKHGAGIVVEVKDNPQLMYYGVGMLEQLQLWTEVDQVVLHIAQPRGFHFDGPLRHWAISTLDLEEWLDETLIPAMKHAEVSRDTKSGDHCRFCPARTMACPQLEGDMNELEELMKTATEKGSVAKLTNTQIGRYLELFDTAKIVAKAANTTAFNRLQAGAKVPGRKLAKSRTNRDWKDGAEKAIKKKFGKDAYTLPVLKSPATVDAMPEGSALTARYAYKPEGGLTVVAQGDTRVAVSKDVKAMFKDQRKKDKTNA